MTVLRLVVACAFAAAPACGAAAASPRTVRVSTSRGSFDMVVFSPKGPAGHTATPIVLLVSGEGGWRKFDGMIAGFFCDAGYWVGGLDVTGYFWNAQDDRELLASDARAYAHALADAADRPADTPIVLAGFSFGADLVPWIAGAGGWGSRVAGLVMIGPDSMGSLEFRLSEILGMAAKDHVFKVADALTSASGIPVLFLHGSKDRDSAAPTLHAAASEPKKLVIVPGAGHHFAGQEETLRAALLEGLAWIRAQRR